MQPETQSPPIPVASIGEELLNLNRVSNKPEPHHCGYCNKEGSCSWGLTKEVMHPLTYELLAEKGWRRCGTYYYKPDIHNSCCKLWTHRMETTSYKISKDQRKTVRHIADWLIEKMDAKLNKPEPKKDAKSLPCQQKKAQKVEPSKIQKNPSQSENKIKMELPKKWQQIAHECAQLLLKTLQERKQQFFSLFLHQLVSVQKKEEFQCKIDSVKVKCLSSHQNADSDFYCNHLMLLFGINKKIFKKGYENIDFVKDVKDFFEKYLNLAKIAHIEVERSGYLLFTTYDSLKMEKKLAKEKQKQMKPEVHQKQHKKQKMKPEKKELSKPKEAGEKQVCTLQLSISSREICFGPLSIVVVPAEVTTESWRMYQRYSEQIHEKPEKSQSSYSGFLCQKALKMMEEANEKPCSHKYSPSWSHENQGKALKGKRTKLMGCYHMKYYIETELIGVGVVDILPHGLSSVYFFYEPKYKDLRLGVFSSLIEIEYIRWLSVSFPEFKYYYMGFYIQNSNKMNYKGNYEPFHLLCPITYQFVQCTSQLRQLIDKIEKGQVKSIQLSQANEKAEEMKFQDIGVYISQKIKIKYQGMMLTLKDLNPRILIPVLGMLRDMVQVWGKQIFEIFTFTF